MVKMGITGGLVLLHYLKGAKLEEIGGNQAVVSQTGGSQGAVIEGGGSQAGVRES